MIHTVPIKSLPQEWLWCETWCSEESKARAKTIDLVSPPASSPLCVDLIVGDTLKYMVSASWTLSHQWMPYGIMAFP